MDLKRQSTVSVCLHLYNSCPYYCKLNIIYIWIKLNKLIWITLKLYKQKGSLLIVRKKKTIAVGEQCALNLLAQCSSNAKCSEYYCCIGAKMPPNPCQNVVSWRLLFNINSSSFQIGCNLILQIDGGIT